MAHFSLSRCRNDFAATHIRWNCAITIPNSFQVTEGPCVVFWKDRITFKQMEIKRRSVVAAAIGRNWCFGPFDGLANVLAIFSSLHCVFVVCGCHVLLKYRPIPANLFLIACFFPLRLSCPIKKTCEIRCCLTFDAIRTVSQLMRVLKTRLAIAYGNTSQIKLDILWLHRAVHIVVIYNRPKSPSISVQWHCCVPC